MLEQPRDGFVVAVVGATGAVGREMLRELTGSGIRVAAVRALASERSVGKTLPYEGRVLTVEKLTAEAFAGVHIALFSAGADRSRTFAPAAVERGAVVVDNSSAFRM